MHVFWVGVGGALGSIARYQLSRLVHHGVAAAEPLAAFTPWLGTLTVNALGCFGMGLLAALSSQSDLVSPTLRLALGTGLLGGFTTYSAFNQETLSRLQQGTWLVATLCVGATLLGCLASGWLGWQCGRVVTFTLS